MFAIQCCLFLSNKKKINIFIKTVFHHATKNNNNSRVRRRAYSYERPYFRWFSKFESGIPVCVSYPCCSVYLLWSIVYFVGITHVFLQVCIWLLECSSNLAFSIVVYLFVCLIICCLVYNFNMRIPKRILPGSKASFSRVSTRWH